MDSEARSAPPTAAATVTTADEARALCAAVERSAALLTEVIDQETGLITAGQPHEVERLQAEKAELSSAYLMDMTRLKSCAEAVRTLAGEEVAALRPKLQELGAKLLRNQDALAAILAVSERLIRAAALNAVAADSGPKAYGRDAQVGQPRIANPATAIDRQL